MSGIIGFFDKTCSPSKGKKRLENMAKMLTHQPYFKNDIRFAQEGVYCSRTDKSLIQPEPQPYINKHLNIWVEGEIYNRNFFGNQFEKKSDPEFISELYLQENGFSFFENVDGIFSIVIYDVKKKKIYFITDRYGFDLLYFYRNKSRLAWFSEAKGALALEYFRAKIDTDAVHDFFSKGYLTGNKSWFKGVKLFPPASVMCWDTSKKEFSTPVAYWDWNKIQSARTGKSEQEIIKKMGILFKRAVIKRAQPISEICVPLSGGLDSRAILAALPKSSPPVHTYTFGKKNCWDITIAREVSKLIGADHHVAHINEKNWLDERTNGIWWTDGQKNLKHMHVLKMLQWYSGKFKISLNGFLGDAIQGGYYLENGEDEFIEKITNRGRRFINEGSRLGKAYGVFYRRPFIDNDLLEFTLSQPIQMRKKSHLYNQMLLQEFPNYFQSIPWQRTGFSISTSKVQSIAKRKVHALRNRSVKLMNHLGIAQTDNKLYHNYPAWLRKTPDFVENILFHNKAIYPEYIDRQQVYSDWQAHLNGKDLSEKVCAYLTFEIFMQQVFEKKYRP